MVNHTIIGMPISLPELTSYHPGPRPTTPPLQFTGPDPSAIKHTGPRPARVLSSRDIAATQATPFTPATPPQPPASITTLFTALLPALTTHLRLHTPWYYLTLYATPTWRIIAVIPSPATTPPPPLLGLLVDYYTLGIPPPGTAGGMFISASPLRPGVSLGLNTTAGNNGTLGGFLVGSRTGRVLGVTAGHLFPAGGKVIQPYFRDGTAHHARLVKDLAELRALLPGLEDEEQEEEKRNARGEPSAESGSDDNPRNTPLECALRLERNILSEILNLERAFRRGVVGRVRYAVARLDGVGVKDVGLIEMEPGMSVANEVNIIAPDGEYTFPGFSGGMGKDLRVGELKAGMRVVKFGKETGATVGWVRGTRDVFWTEEAGEMELEVLEDCWCREGDAGAWVFGGEGEVVAMVIGGVEAYDEKGGEVVRRAVVVRMESVMRWAENVHGEEFTIGKLDGRMKT